MRRRLDLYTYFKLLLEHKEEIQAHNQEDAMFRLSEVSGIYLGHGLWYVTRTTIPPVLSSHSCDAKVSAVRTIT